MKFLHTGDLHLGRKLSSEFSPELKERIRSDERNLLLNIILYANENEIPYIFISGDLFDSNVPEASLVSFVMSCFERYFGRIFIIAGNHDYLSNFSVYATEVFPENVYIFGGEISAFETDDAIIYGQSFTAPHKNTNSFSCFEAEETDKAKIMLMHTDFKADSLYNPVKLSDIEYCGLSYIAAGHIHIKGEAFKRGETYVSYCGAPQNLNFKEAGNASVISGKISDGFTELAEVDISCHRYLNLTVDISEAQSDDEVLSICSKIIYRENPSDTLFKLDLIGKVEGFEPDIERISEVLSGICLHISVEKCFTKKYSISILEKENSVRGEFVRQVLTLYGNEDNEFIEKVIEKGMKFL